MSAYQYQALKKNGATVKGLIEADSERHARQLLREQELVPTQLDPLKKKAVFSGHKKLTLTDLSLFTRQLATLLAAGIPVDESLSSIAEQTNEATSRQLIIAIRIKVLEGYGLAQAMSEYPHAFSELYCATVAAGEQTGHLDIILDKLAEYIERQQNTKQKIQQALIYPSIMAVVSIAIIGFLLTFVVPKIIDVFTSSGQSLPTMTIILISLSTFSKNYGIYICLNLTILIVIMKKSLQNKRILAMSHRLILCLPLISYLNRSINVSRYIYTFSILFSSGVNILETMRVAANLVSNLPIRHAFNLAATRVREGTSINQALKDTHFLSAMAVHLIANGERSGQLSIMMERAALLLENDVKRVIDNVLTLLEPLVILLMGAIILFIVLATLLPIFSMEQLIV